MAAPWFREWSACQNLGLQYLNGDTRDRMLQQGILLLDRFRQEDRIQIRQQRRSQKRPGRSSPGLVMLHTRAY